jgi:Fe-S oxidoreductase
MPGIVNALVKTPGLGKLVQVIGGISIHRKMPVFATETFKDWWKRQPPRNVGRPPVMLWADTFNNHFHPQTLKAALEVLEDAGFRVMVPRASLCCGRPLYDFGMFDTAERLLRQVLDTLRPEIETGIPFVGLEPSCVAVFRDELRGPFPMDDDATRLHNNFLTLAEFLEKKAEGYRVPTLRRRAIVHGHCHHSHVMTLAHDQSLLRNMGLNFEMLDSGCCGMAGSFGFEANHVDISVAVGERVLLPSVRQAEDDTLIIADGFSCREQIAGLTDRGALHLAQVLQMALHEGELGVHGELPETEYQALGKWEPAMTPGVVALALGAGALLGFGLVRAAARLSDRRRSPWT